MRNHGEAPQSRERFDIRRRDGQTPIVHGRHPGMQRDVTVRRAGDRLMRRHHEINRYPHYRRIDRGLTVPQYWWGPRFNVMNWGRYGLPQPMHGGRWVRYYDDALLVDSYGRVHDGRWGMRWDEYEDQWDYDHRGIPVYVGDGDFYPGDEDYAWVEEQQGPGRPMGYGHHQQGYGYPAHPGYGMVVTETTVTTSPTIITETFYEDVVQSAPRKAAPAPSSATLPASPARFPAR
jgi:Ni/Co efflux regulator RcnB